MTGHLPQEFFSEFFQILEFSPEEAKAFQDKLHEMAQRKYLEEQLQILPELEQDTFNSIMKQEGISPATMNEFLDARIENAVQQELWQKSMLWLWQHILEAVGGVASAEQKERIKQLVQSYLVPDLD